MAHSADLAMLEVAPALQKTAEPEAKPDINGNPPDRARPQDLGDHLSRSCASAMRSLEPFSSEESGSDESHQVAANGHGASNGRDHSLAVETVSMTESNPSVRLERFRATRSALANRHRPREVACFQCDHKFETPIGLKEIICPGCQEENLLGDFEINSECYDSIETHGQVTVNSRGSIVAERVRCRTLKAFGRLEADVQVEEDAVLRGRSSITGDMKCRRIDLGRDGIMHVSGDMEVEEIHIDGMIEANAVKARSIVIGERGVLKARVQTQTVQVEDGGSLLGDLSIRADNPRPVAKG